jgi:hypothetical protein
MAEEEGRAEVMRERGDEGEIGEDAEEGGEEEEGAGGEEEEEEEGGKED